MRGPGTSQEEGGDGGGEDAGRAAEPVSWPQPPAPPSSNFRTFKGALWTQSQLGWFSAREPQESPLSPHSLSVLINKMGLKSQSSESWGDREEGGFRNFEDLCVVCVQ